MERRKHSRIALKEPIACLCHVDGGEVLHGIIKNVGLMGVMLEVMDLCDKLTMECGVHVHLEEKDNQAEPMFSGMTGMLNWAYKDYVGVGFELPVKPSQEELVAWLKSQDQLGEDVI